MAERGLFGAATGEHAAEQEHQRAAGASHGEWEPFSGLLRLTGSALSGYPVAPMAADARRLQAGIAGSAVRRSGMAGGGRGGGAAARARPRDG